MYCTPLFLGTLLLSVGFLVLDYTAEAPAHINSPITVVKRNEVIERELKKHQEAIGSDYPGYRMHLYRVLSFTKHFLGPDKFAEKADVIASALVYHDIGLWTDSVLSYLEPSIVQAQKHTSNIFSQADQNLQAEIIYWHHKFTAYTPTKGSVPGFETPEELQLLSEIVNAVRKSDWIDATLGFVTHGMPRSHIALVREELPNEGFHQTLLGFGYRLHGWNLLKHLDLCGIMKW